MFGADGAAPAAGVTAGDGPNKLGMANGGGGGGAGAAAPEACGHCIPCGSTPRGITVENTLSNSLRQYGNDLVDAIEIPAARQQTNIPDNGKPALDRRNKSEMSTPSTPSSAPIAPTGTATSPSHGTQHTTQQMIPSASDATPNALWVGGLGSRRLTLWTGCSTV
jgi:hypothetical protein